MPAGVVQDADVADVTTTLVQALPPTVMLEAPVKFVPVIVIDVPPAVLPDVGDMDVTVGVAIFEAPPKKSPNMNCGLAPAAVVMVEVTESVTVLITLIPAPAPWLTANNSNPSGVNPIPATPVDPTAIEVVTALVVVLTTETRGVL